MTNKSNGFYSGALLRLFFGLSLVFLYIQTALGAPGDLDRMFGTGGKAVATIADTHSTIRCQ